MLKKKLIFTLLALFFLCVSRAESGTLTVTGGGGSLAVTGGGGNLAMTGGNAGTFMESWDYRKSHVISGSSAGAQTNYQVQFVVHRTTGTDSGVDVYVGTKVADDYDDLRFTASDGVTFLDYWIESSDSSSATVWVEVPSIPASPDTITIYMYYGNASAAAISNGDNTFSMFDDFTGTSLDTNKWSLVGSSYGTCNVASSIVTIYCSSSTNAIYIKSANQFGTNYSFRTKYKTAHSGLNATAYEFIYWYNMSGSDYIAAFYYYTTGSPPVYYSGVSGSSSSVAVSGWSANTWHIQEIKRNGSTSVIFEVDDANAVTKSTDIPTTSQSIEFYSFNTGTVYSDWMLIRKYANPEPAHSTWGSEE